MPAFVLDASVTIAALAPDQQDHLCIALLARAVVEPVAVPAIWFYEVHNILSLKHRRGVMSSDAYARTLGSQKRLRIECETSSLAADCERASLLAGRYGLTVYDATYLELAIRLNLPLATRDKALMRAAREAGMVILPD